MFKTVEYLTDGRTIVHGYDPTKHEAEIRKDSVLMHGRAEDFSIVVVEKVTKC